MTEEIVGEEESLSFSSEDTTEFDFPVSKFPISCHFMTKDELPEDLNDFAEYGKAYASFRNLHKGKYTREIYNLYTFSSYMRQMYREAYNTGTIAHFTYDGTEYIDFPVENTANTSRLYASFVPDSRHTGRWFCIGIRLGSKIHDIAVLDNATRDYKFIKTHADLEGSTIDSKNALRQRIEDAFVDASISGEVYQYTYNDQTYMEYPTGIMSTKKMHELYIMFRYAPERKKWIFAYFLSHSLEKSIEDNVHSAMRRIRNLQNKSERKAAEKKQELEEKEREYLKQEAEKQLIEFREFPLRKIDANLECQQCYNLEAFSYIDYENIPLLFIPRQKIDLRDPDIILDALEEAFLNCNPYQDIGYFSYNNSEFAELKLSIPGYEQADIYARFERNKLPGRQPWFLTPSLIYMDLYHRNLFVQDYEKTLENLLNLFPPCTITSAGELEAYMDNRFMEAISKNEILVYGDADRMHLELPMHLEGIRIHAVFTKSGRAIPWTISGFRIRTGEDIRFCISDEYKAENSAEAKPEVKEYVVAEQPVIKKEVVEKKAVFQGETVLDESGYPMDLMKFSRYIPPVMLQFLAEMAEEEQWSFSEEDPYSILIQYLNERFIRLGFEGKIGIYHGRSGDEYAAFHTGLYSRDFHEPIYACFLPQYHDEYFDGPLWHLDGFCCKTEGGAVFERMKKFFPVYPPDADFMKQDGEYLPSWKYVMDSHLPISLTQDHILQERGYRLPADFLEKVFRKCKDNQALLFLRKMSGMELDSEKKEFWMQEFSPYLENAAETYRYLLRQMEYVVQEARDCNIRQPIQAYYPRDNEVNWFLPLRFHEDSNLKNLVLIVRAKDPIGYEGITVLNIEDIYHHARAISNPDCSWLRREILDSYRFSVKRKGDEGECNESE